MTTNKTQHTINGTNIHKHMCKKHKHIHRHKEQHNIIQNATQKQQTKNKNTTHMTSNKANIKNTQHIHIHAKQTHGTPRISIYKYKYTQHKYNDNTIHNTQ